MNTHIPFDPPLSFLDQNAITIDPLDLPKYTSPHLLIFVPSDGKILHYGDDYGINSCLLNQKLNNKENHIIVNNSKYINTLEDNRKNNNSKFKIISNNTYQSKKSIEEITCTKFNVIILSSEEYISYLKEDEDEDENQYENVKIIIFDFKLSTPHPFSNDFFCINKETYSVYFNTKHLPFNIISYYVADGDLGLFGQLGYFSETSELNIQEPGVFSASLHAPSHFVIETKRDLIVKGYSSPTSKICPLLTFKINDEIIGKIQTPATKTFAYRLPKGTHSLGIHPSDISWAHSVWLFEDVKEIHSDQKYFKIDIKHTGCGFVNQLINLINGLTLSQSTNRWIYNPRFLPNYNSTECIPMSEIFDIDQLNRFFETMNLDVRIVCDELIGNQNWKKNQHYNSVCHNLDCRKEIYNKLMEDDYQFIDLGSVFSVTLEKTPFTEEFEREFYKNMSFTSNFNNAFEYIRREFLNETYNVVHLRLEDDFISPYSGHFGHSYENYTTILLNRYFELMEKMFSPQDHIYIATHLLKSPYPNNYVIDKIRNKYPNIITTVPWRQHINLPEGREIDAIVDYLICTNGQKFIGMHGSTFSILISQIHNSKGHESDLVDLHA